MPPLKLWGECALDENVKQSQNSQRNEARTLNSRAIHVHQRRSDSAAVGLGIGLTLFLLLLLIIAYASVKKMGHQPKKKKKAKKKKKGRKKLAQHHIHHCHVPSQEDHRPHTHSHDTHTHSHRQCHHRQQQHQHHSPKHRQRHHNKRRRQHLRFFNARENWSEGPDPAMEMPQIWSQEPSQTTATQNPTFNEMDAPQDEGIEQDGHWERLGWNMAARPTGRPRFGRHRYNSRHQSVRPRVS